MPKEHAPLSPLRRRGPPNAPCWREVVCSALDGCWPTKMRLEALIDWVEAAR